MSAFDRVSEDTALGEKVLDRALPKLEEPAGGEVSGRVAISPNAYDDIVEELNRRRLRRNHPRDLPQPRLALAARRPARSGRRARLPAEDGDGDPQLGAALGLSSSSPTGRPG